MASLRQTTAQAPISNTHGFLWVLHCKLKLQRLYTQNIDGLEARIGIPLVESPNHRTIKGGYVALHGSLTQVRCSQCFTKRLFGREYVDEFLAGETASCPLCVARGEFLALPHLNKLMYFIDHSK
jgi:NAD-dependent SIR2 family protein deacetylase